ncbi:MAG: lipoate--protein ligase family protein [Halobacteriales archaeon]|nr:lipoate--protein ligase family protein [Halobacteriales archaeon]
MHVLRGRADRERDRELTAALAERAATEDERGLRVWTPHKQIAFGRRDVRSDGYHQAREIAIEHGYEPVERSTGGRAVAYTGRTVGFVFVQPIDDIRHGLGDRYERATETAQRALWRLGVPAQRGEPEDAFCPGDHSLQWHGKIVGIAQRVRRDVATVGGIVITDQHRAIAEVLTPIYDRLDIPFDPDSVGSIERAGGNYDPDAVIDAFIELFTSGHETTVESVDDAEIID